MNEDPDGKDVYGIFVTPLELSDEDKENGHDGSYAIATYSMDEETSFQEDFNEIEKALEKKED